MVFVLDYNKKKVETKHLFWNVQKKINSMIFKKNKI